MKYAACHPDRKHRARGMCGSCYTSNYGRTHPRYREKQIAWANHWQQGHKERVLELKKARYWKNPEKYRKASLDYTLKSSYGLNREEYNVLFEKQKGACAICGRVAPGRNRLAVDHDHATRRVRGLLCTNCNTGIGKLGDTCAGLHRALNYLQQAEGDAK